MRIRLSFHNIGVSERMFVGFDYSQAIVIIKLSPSESAILYVRLIHY